MPGPDGGAGLRWGVEPMCEALSRAGIAISASTYYEWIAKQPTRRHLRDAEPGDIITAQRADKKTGNTCAAPPVRPFAPGRCPDHRKSALTALFGQAAGLASLFGQGSFNSSLSREPVACGIPWGVLLASVVAMASALTMPWPRAVLLSAGPATFGFALSYLNPWLGIGVLSTDIVLGILVTPAPPLEELTPER